MLILTIWLILIFRYRAIGKASPALFQQRRDDEALIAAGGLSDAHLAAIAAGSFPMTNPGLTATLASLRRVRWWFVGLLAVWVLMFGEYQSSVAEAAEGARVVDECKAAVEAGLQECMAPGHALALSASGPAARLEVLLWVLGVL